MDLLRYDQKYVQLKNIYGDTVTGMAVHHSADYVYHEYGVDEEAIQIDDLITYKSQVESIEEAQRRGTSEIWTERLILRRCRPEDAEELYRQLGVDPTSYEYSGWNPYATLEMARETVRRDIAAYGDDRHYSWILDIDDVIVGTIGAYHYTGDQIEVGFSIVKGWRGRGLGTEALTAILEYLTGNENIPRVVAWCASENIASKRALEKSGMTLVSTEKNGLVVEDRVYDKLNYEYRCK